MESVGEVALRAVEILKPVFDSARNDPECREVVEEFDRLYTRMTSPTTRKRDVVDMFNQVQPLLAELVSIQNRSVRETPYNSLKSPETNDLNTSETEYIGTNVMRMNANEKAGRRFFYNAANTIINPATGRTKVLRAFEEGSLNKLQSNPFTRKDWTDPSDLYKLPDSGGNPVKNKEYYVYKKRNYSVHTGPAGGRYIVSNGHKKYIP